MSKLFSEYGYDIWWKWNLEELLPEYMKPLKDILYI
jgi:hypothetical protein